MASPGGSCDSNLYREVFSEDGGALFSVPPAGLSLTPADRERVVSDLMALRLRHPKLEAPKGLIEVYAHPPSSPD